MTAQLLTASRARCARACRRQHHLRYVLGYRAARDASTLRFGTLMHAALEAWWLAKQAGHDEGTCLALALAAIRNANPDDAFEAAKASVMMVGYHLRWKDEPLTVLAVEQRFEGPLLNPATGRPSPLWRLAGKLDVVVRSPDGRVWLVEHKTSSEDVSAGSDYWKRLKMDGQVSVYFEGGRILGHDVAGCIYDVLLKPALKPSQVPVLDEAGQKVVLDRQGQRVRTAKGGWRQTGDSAEGYVVQTRPETVDEYRERLLEAVSADLPKYFARGEVVRLEAELAGHLLDVWQLAAQLREEALAQRYPRNPDACVRYGSTCEFFGVCAGEASLDDPTLFVRVDDVHPELSEQSNPQSPKEETSWPSPSAA